MYHKLAAECKFFCRKLKCGKVRSKKGEVDSQIRMSLAPLPAMHILTIGILIDGYNRFSIASKHNIPFKVEHLEFDSREAVKIWMITNQISRRNLSPMQLSYFRGKHYNLEKLIAGNPTLANEQNSQCYQTDNIVPQGRTATRLATH